MKLAIIAAMDKSRVIGNKNKLPWHLSADLKYFKKVTMGKPVIMGRKTYESIGRILPGRQNIVVTRNPDYQIKDSVPENASVNIVHNLDEAIKIISEDSEEVMIIGGSTLFTESLPKTETLYLTYIDENFAGDTFFPEIDSAQWQEIWREDHEANEKDLYGYSFVKLIRR